MADNESEKAYHSWPADFPEVTSLVSYVALRRNPDPELQALYDRAKNHEDQEAAVELIQQLVTDDGVEKIKALAARNPQAVVVSVHAVEGRGKNALPSSLAAFIGKIGNLEIDTNIVQTSIVGNTGQNTWHRFAHRATFEGSVKPGRDYVLVDDIFSAGGTFSELRNFIETNGSNVVNTVTMANGAKSLNAQLSVTEKHVLELERKFGIESLQRFLKEEHLYGGNYQALTDAEARTLLGAKTLDEAGDRIAEARQEESYRIRPEVVPGTSPDTESLNTQNTDHTTHLSPAPARPRQMSYTETLDTLKNAYTDALSRYGIKSDEAARTYKAYKDYELIKKIDPRGVRVGRYDKDDGQAARMIAAIQTRLDREQEQRERLIPKPVPQEAEKNTMDDLFKHVQENGRYQYLETPREVADSRGEYHFTDIHTLHTAADLTADKLFADDISRQQIDLSSSPFWATVWSDAELGVAENIIPIKNTYDLINMYDRFYDRYGVSGHEIDAYLQDIPFPDAALYEAEKEQNTMSDETNEAGEGFKEQPAPEQEAALGPGEPAEQEAPNETENGMTPEDKVMNKLFDQVRENGHYQYLKTSGEVADDYGNYSYQDIHTLHTAADLMADKRFAGGLSNYFAFFAETDLSSSPFWATVWTNNLTEQYGSLENIVPIKNGNDFFDMYDSFYNRYEISGYEIMANLQDIITLPEPEQKTASYEAENDISKEQNTMSDEINEETGEGFEEQPAPEQEAAFGPGEPAEQEAPNEAEGLGQEPRERPSPDEIAFRTALKMRTQIAESLQNGSLPCLPGADGIADTKPAVNLITGTRYHGANLLCLKDFQKRNGFPTAEYATQDAIQKSGIPIRAGESGIMISFAEKNKQTGDWENKNVRLFNVAQTAKPWAFKTYAEKVSQEKEREQEAFFKSQYGDKYQPREKTEQKPGPDITCSSTEPERYLSQYLAAVSMGSAFKATHQQATEFSQKLNNRLYEPVENGYPDPFKLSKICKEASVQCKEIIKEIKQPQQKQDQTQQHSRHM